MKDESKSESRGYKKQVKKQTMNNKTELVFIFLLLAILFVFWLPTRDIPYWWDSAGYIIRTAKQFVETNFNPIVPRDEYTDFAHPPFFIVVLAIFWKIFGESLFISHLVNFIFTFLIIFYTYLLGKELIKDKILGNLIGFLSGILLLFTPVFFAQLGIIYVEIPATALAVMTVYYGLKKNLWGYFISSSLMILTKEIAIFVIFIFLSIFSLNEIFQHLKKKEKLNFVQLFKKIFLWSIPLYILLLWFLYHKIISGWWLVVPGRELGGGLGLSFNRIWMVSQFLFFEQWRFIPTLFILFSGIAAIFKKDFKKHFLELKILLIGSIPIITALLFGITEFLHRYIIIALPFLYLLFFYGLALFLKEKTAGQQMKVGAVITLVLAFLFSFSWDNHREIKTWRFPPLEENLEYLNVIEIGKEMASFIERHYSDAVVYTAFPTDYMISEPFQHYISKPIETYNCKDFKENDRVDLVVFHLLSPPQVKCVEIIQTLGLKRLVTFEKNGKWIQIYK